MLRGQVACGGEPCSQVVVDAADTPPPPKVTGVELYVADSFKGWRAAALRAARLAFDKNGGKVPDGWIPSAVAAASESEELAGFNEKSIKSTTMPFLKAKGAEAAEGGKQVCNCLMLFCWHPCVPL